MSLQKSLCHFKNPYVTSKIPMSLNKSVWSPPSHNGYENTRTRSKCSHVLQSCQLHVESIYIDCHLYRPSTFSKSLSWRQTIEHTAELNILCLSITMKSCPAVCYSVANSPPAGKEWPGDTKAAARYWLPEVAWRRPPPHSSSAWKQERQTAVKRTRKCVALFKVS